MHFSFGNSKTLRREKLMNQEEIPKWKYFIPFYGIFVTYKDPNLNKGKWWAVSIISTLIAISMLGGEKKEKNQASGENTNNVSISEDTSGSVQIPNLAEKISVTNCGCKISKVKTKDAEYVASVRIVDAKFEDKLKCSVTFLNTNEKTINSDFSVTWKLETKTGTEIKTYSDVVKENLPPKMKVSWDYELDSLFVKDTFEDIKKRLSKTTCEISNVKAKS